MTEGVADKVAKATSSLSIARPEQPQTGKRGRESEGQEHGFETAEQLTSCSTEGPPANETGKATGEATADANEEPAYKQARVETSTGASVFTPAQEAQMKRYLAEVLAEKKQIQYVRHRTGFTDTRRLTAEGFKWKQDVQSRIACSAASVDTLLQPKQPLLAELRYLALLHNGRHIDASNILAMKRSHRRGEADDLKEYRPHILAMLQAAASGQFEIQFHLPDPTLADNAQPQLCCTVNGDVVHPGAIRSKNVQADTTDTTGIYCNMDAFGEIHKTIKSSCLQPGTSHVFFCPFVVRIEGCWIARLVYEWNDATHAHDVSSCSICPAIPSRDEQLQRVLCYQLDDMLQEFDRYARTTLTDLLTMTGNTKPTPGFQMLVQYVNTLCHLHSVPIEQVKLRLPDDTCLDTSQVRVLAHGHKALVIRLGEEDAVYKIGRQDLIGQEIMIHKKVDATVRFITKSGACGSVEGIGSNLSFFKMQGVGQQLDSCLPGDLPAAWSRMHEAVTGLHQAGVFHRDIKPDNMLLINSHIYLTDFDVSCLMDERTSLVGTEEFRSPFLDDGVPYRQTDDLASLLLSFATLMRVQGRSKFHTIQQISTRTDVPQSMVDVATRVLTLASEEVNKQDFGW